MAKKLAARKITRRDAVVLLGAGAAVGMSAPVQPQQPAQDKACSGEAYVVEQSRTGPAPHKKIMFVDSCCSETSNAILVGVEHPGKNPTGGGKKHLKPLQDKLSQGGLAEYCYMIWGLTESDLKMLKALVPERLGVKTDTPK